MKNISGITQITINGTSYDLTDGSVKFEMATINREPVMSKSGTIYTKETPVAAKLSFSIFVPSNVDPSQFNSMTDTNIVVSEENGMVINATGFASSGNNSYDANEGTLETEWFGTKLTVTTAS